MGKSTTFAYDTSHTYSAGYLLTNVTAADGASFTLHYDHPDFADYVTSITTSYSASISFSFGETDPNGNSYGSNILTGITDAAGMKSQLFYDGFYANVSELITPYGTTLL